MTYGDLEIHAWIELDRATESVPWLTTKAKAYGHYFDTGREQAAAGVFPLCVWIVPDDRRADDLTRALAAIPPAHLALHRIATQDNAIEQLLTINQPEGGPT